MSLLLAVLCLARVAQDARPSTSAAELPAAKCAEFEGALERLAEQYHVPGMSAALVHHRALAWSHGFGYADLEQGVWATPETRYRLASVSKPFAAVLVLQLVEQGKLSLDAPLKDFWIPRWFAPDPARYREQPILLRHVLSHTSEGVPGDAYSYSGNIYSDLTWVLEQVTHVAYPRLLQERVFDRAGMERSVPGHVRPGTAELVELAKPYRWDGTDHVRGTWQMMDPDPALDLSEFAPVLRMPDEMQAQRRELLGDGFLHLNAVCAAGEATSTVLDLAKFDIALDEGRLLDAASRERMWTPAASSSGKKLPYALGWFVEEIAGRKVMWHYGWLPPSVSALYVKVPEAELTFVLLANNDKLSDGFSWTAQGVRASPFARVFLETFGLLPK
ncbi:MAG: class A beta-lactamase-related serine hydrolase [Planctomycetes bacterium]|nr:class A beta-lactamase-related serine hydrolase [Planctomycetota bacterium]